MYTFKTKDALAILSFCVYGCVQEKDLHHNHNSNYPISNKKYNFILSHQPPVVMRTFD